MLKDLFKVTSEKGDLTALNKIEQFDAKRMFYVTGVPKGSIRGVSRTQKRQANTNLCVKGAIKVTLDTGASPSEYYLEEGKAIFMDTLV